MKWSVFVLLEDDSHSPKFRPSLDQSPPAACSSSHSFPLGCKTLGQLRTQQSTKFTW